MPRQRTRTRKTKQNNLNSRTTPKCKHDWKWEGKAFVYTNSVNAADAITTVDLHEPSTRPHIFHNVSIHIKQLREKSWFSVKLGIDNHSLDIHYKSFASPWLYGKGAHRRLAVEFTTARSKQKLKPAKLELRFVFKEKTDLEAVFNLFRNEAK